LEHPDAMPFPSSVADSKVDSASSDPIADSNGESLNGHHANSDGHNGHNGQLGGLAAAESVGRHTGDGDMENETMKEPANFGKARLTRRFGVCAESIKSGYYKAPYWVKHQAWETALFEALEACFVFQRFSKKDIWTFVHTAEVHLRYEKEVVTEQGAAGDALMVLLDGSIDYFKDGKFVKKVDKPGTVIDPTNVIWKTPSAYRLVAHEEVTFAKLRREDFTNISVRLEFYKHEEYQELLRNTALLETLHDEGIRKLADIAVVRTYQKGDRIIKQGEEGHTFYLLLSGAAKAWTQVGDDEQDCAHYIKGGLFGELALTDNKPRAANVTCTETCQALCLTKEQFERMICPMNSLAKQAYLTDPRKLIADFYEDGDSRGPMGSLKLQDLVPQPEQLGSSTWFAVYRPTSRDAIMKMLSGSAVGKGLNVKGKSAKQGVLSGYVPFCQISDNKHKAMIEKSPPGARLLLYFKTEPNRQEAFKAMQQVLEDPESRLDITTRKINKVDDYEPRAYGLDLPEPLLREAYIMRRDLEPKIGWETGRRSEPAFMDMNLHAIRDPSEPKVVLYQHDESDPMNPRGLLIAYAEQFVKPVVSDFDTFCIGSRGMTYDPLPSEQTDLVKWCLKHTENVLKSLDGNPWTSRWLTILAEEKKNGFHPHLPKYGFGDPTSYRLIGDVVKQTETCGAVRHGAECCNFMFPQELDDEFLVVWHGFPSKPWAYYTEEQVREWLIERAKEGFTIPLNPVWPVRDQGWYEVLQVLRQSEEAQPALEQWFPSSSGILDLIDSIHKECPKGFTMKT